MLMVNVVCVRLFQKPFQVIAQIRVQEADLNARMILFVGMAVLTAPFSLGLSNRSFRQNLQH
jgi:hypothetical protein